jgi:hypothetical protein
MIKLVWHADALKDQESVAEDSSKHRTLGR